MKITTETLPERQVKLQIEIEPDQHAEAMEQAYKRLAPRVQIRGFRPGKAPRPLIEKQLGHHRLLDEAMDILVPQAYREAIEEQNLVPVAQPSVELVSHEPLVFTATVPLQPVVDLGDYQSIRVPREAVTVTDEEVEKSIEELRRRYGTIEPVDRAAQKGDVIRGDLRASADGATLFEQDEIEYRLTDESLASLPGLADAIVGMTKGETKDTSFTAPDDFEDTRMAGKAIDYHIVVHDVKEERLADEDEAFAKQVGEGFDSVKALRDRIREDLLKAKEDTNRREYETLVIDALVEKATAEYPSVLVEHEIEHILEEQANLDPRDPRAQDLYLQRLGKSEEEVKASVRDEAERKMLRSLVLSHFAEAENISIGDEDVEAELTRMAEEAGEQGPMIRQLFDNENGRDTLRRSLLTRRTLDRLIEIGSQASEEAPAAETGKPAPQSRRSAPRQTEA